MSACDPVFCALDDAVACIRRGGMVVVVDDADRENEGDLVMAASRVTPAAVNFMIRYGRGLVCVPLTPTRLDQLQLPLMSTAGRDPLGTAFTVSVDAAHGITTGISAHDRAHTIRLLADPAVPAAAFVTPGHVFPLRACPGGVRVRRGHTEASVALARLAGLTPAGVICEIINDDGSMARLPELQAFCRHHGLGLLTIADLCAELQRRQKGRPAQSGGRTGGLEGRREASTRISRP